MADITHIGDLIPDGKNARKHTPRNVGMIVDALHEVGAARSIVIDDEGNILAGNGTVEAAAEAGIERVQVVDADGETLVAVRRTGLTKAQKKRLALFDNRTAELAGWEPSVLAEFAQDGIKLDDLFVSDELDAILAGLEQAPEPGAGGDEFDTTPEVGPTVCQPGDLWQLGPHRLLCGDSTKREDVERLMGGEKAQCIFTDPPYGVAYDGGMKKREALANDDVGAGIYNAALPTLAVYADNRAPLYLWYADAHAAAAAAAAAAAGYVITAQIVWAKNHAQFVSSAHYHGKHEPCYYAHKRGQTARWHGPSNEVTLWEYDRSPSNDWHPTQKPVDLAVRAIRNSTAGRDMVLDGFMGGGTTLIAAHRLGRRCYGLEIEPRYCDVILRRYEAETGDAGVRLD